MKVKIFALIFASTCLSIPNLLNATSNDDTTTTTSKPKPKAQFQVPTGQKLQDFLEGMPEEDPKPKFKMSELEKANISDFYQQQWFKDLHKESLEDIEHPLSGKSYDDFLAYLEKLPITKRLFLFKDYVLEPTDIGKRLLQKFASGTEFDSQEEELVNWWLLAQRALGFSMYLGDARANKVKYQDKAFTFVLVKDFSPSVVIAQGCHQSKFLQDQLEKVKALIKNDSSKVTLALRLLSFLPEPTNLNQTPYFLTPLVSVWEELKNEESTSKVYDWRDYLIVRTEMQRQIATINWHTKIGQGNDPRVHNTFKAGLTHQIF